MWKKIYTVIELIAIVCAIIINIIKFVCIIKHLQNKEILGVKSDEKQ